MILLLHGIEDLRWAMLPEKALAAAMLFWPGLLTRRLTWVSLSILAVWNNMGNWPFLVNHEYLITYWVLACTLALYAFVPTAVMAWNARLLIGLCFSFATLWKLLSGEYLDGSFLHLTVLLDPRLSSIALLSGVSAETLQANADLFSRLQTSGFSELRTNPLISSISLLLSYWTLLIEGLVALSFLCPRPRWLYQRRDWGLLLFTFTTYTIIPVFSFAAVLLVLGLAQCEYPQRERLYLQAWLLIPIWMVLPQALFYLLRLLVG
ncbi:hypothetical protein IQ241_02715 [Romeria aff. gracilis LEGE 07310]|uniref:Uncharacterized protein n=1 Tax=Vasconcelosia minhoensis LEGE 07310 TaxID=915328 RepID=A0A8J7A4N9_9CYAN|nr:hypothetical protein [Romeria gracilis]MBE9076217.1 hypothetical protein [Romeria aff. gracilis LEGE 07310]